MMQKVGSRCCSTNFDLTIFSRQSRVSHWELKAQVCNAVACRNADFGCRAERSIALGPIEAGCDAPVIMCRYVMS